MLGTTCWPKSPAEEWWAGGRASQGIVKSGGRTSNPCWRRGCDERRLSVEGNKRMGLSSLNKGPPAGCRESRRRHEDSVCKGRLGLQSGREASCGQGKSNADV